MDTRPIWQDCGEPGNSRDGTAEGGPSCARLMNQKRPICYINGKKLVLDAELPGLAEKRRQTLNWVASVRQHG